MPVFTCDVEQEAEIQYSEFLDPITISVHNKKVVYIIVVDDCFLESRHINPQPVTVNFLISLNTI